MLWYLKTPTKTKDADFTQLELYEYSHHLKICEHIVKAMALFLSKVDTPEEINKFLYQTQITGYGKKKLF